MQFAGVQSPQLGTKRTSSDVRNSVANGGKPVTEADIGPTPSSSARAASLQLRSFGSQASRLLDTKRIFASREPAVGSKDILPQRWSFATPLVRASFRSKRKSLAGGVTQVGHRSFHTAWTHSRHRRSPKKPHLIGLDGFQLSRLAGYNTT
jgi:hypothetical protein